MYTIEFEADIQDGMVKIPEKYSQLENSHARIVVMVVEPKTKGLSESSLDLSNCGIKAFDGKDGLEIQRELRDEW